MALSQQVQKIGLKEAIRMWEDKESSEATANGRPIRKISEVSEVKLNGWQPPIEKLDGSTSLLVKCEKLSLSTNMIDRLSNLNSLKCLKILSVGRNYLKNLQGIEACADTLEELWASYNQIVITKPALACKKLRVLYLACNAIQRMEEVSVLVQLPMLEDLVLVGNLVEEKYVSQNPIDKAPRIEGVEEKAANPKEKWTKYIGKLIPHLKKVDGNDVVHDEVE